MARDLAEFDTAYLDRIWLLDRLWSFSESLVEFTRPEMNLSLNVHDPPSGKASIPATVAGAWRDGLVAFCKARVPIEPLSVDEVHRWFVERDRQISVGLTPGGGRVWEAAFDVQWTNFVEWTNQADVSFVGIDRARVRTEVEARFADRVDAIVWGEVLRWTPRVAYWASFDCAVVATVPGVRLATPGFSEGWRAAPYLGVHNQARIALDGVEGWELAADVPVERLRGASVRAAFATPDDPDPTLQLELVLVNHERGILELRGFRWADHYLWLRALEYVEHGVVSRARLRSDPGRLEFSVAWPPGVPQAEHFPTYAFSTEGLRWWRHRP